jgi:hypothetical protein
MGFMIKQIRYLGVAGFLTFASAGFAQYTMALTGVGNGNSAGGVYVSPYMGSIWNGTPSGSPLYSGAVICDDFSDESYVGDVWNATAVNASNLNGSELFTTSDTAYTVQQNYDAVAWLANQLLLDDNDPTAQANYSFAIWDIMDGASTDPDGGALTLIGDAFTAIQTSSNIYTNVTVFTPAPKGKAGSNPSQEFLVVGGGSNGGPLVQAPEPASASLLGFDLLSVAGIAFLLRRYRVRS